MCVLRNCGLGVHPSERPSKAALGPLWNGRHGALSSSGILQQVRATDDLGGHPIRMDRRVVRAVRLLE